MTDGCLNPRRRRLMRLAVTVPIVVVAAPRLAGADDKPRLDPASERAQQLSYTHDASTSDHPKRKADATCANCTHYHGDAGDPWATCNIFSSHLVNANGWCSSWFSAG